MKICVVSDKYYPHVGGGAEVSLRFMLESLAKRTNIKVNIIALNNEGKSKRYKIINRIKIKYLDLIHDINLRTIRDQKKDNFMSIFHTAPYRNIYTIS